MKIIIEAKGKTITREVQDWAFDYMSGSSKMLGDILKAMYDETEEVIDDKEDRNWNG